MLIQLIIWLRKSSSFSLFNHLGNGMCRRALLFRLGRELQCNPHLHPIQQALPHRTSKSTRTERLSSLPKVTRRKEQRLGFEPRQSNPRGPMPYQHFTQHMGQWNTGIVLTGAHLKPLITVRPTGGIQLVFCCCFRSALLTT